MVARAEAIADAADRLDRRPRFHKDSPFYKE